MKKGIIFKTILFTSVIALSGLFFTGCPDVNGLHNQQAANLTIVFTNFPDSVTGDYSIPGDFNGDEDWENGIDNIDIVMKNGEGTSNQFSVTATWIKFSRVKTKDTSWLRGWSSEVTGNAADNGKYINFWADVDLSAGDITVTVDGSSGTAVVTAE